MFSLKSEVRFFVPAPKLASLSSGWDQSKLLCPDLVEVRKAKREDIVLGLKIGF